MILIKLLAAIIMIESGGNDLAYNKREDACGCLQIRPIMVAEFNRIGIPFTLDNRWNCGKSMKAFDMWVLTNRYANAEVIARKWNGGPNGHKKASTLKYWKKVKQQLQTNKPR
jgi:hypothetical protein